MHHARPRMHQKNMRPLSNMHRRREVIQASRQDADPQVWGPVLWNLLFAAAERADFDLAASGGDDSPTSLPCTSFSRCSKKPCHADVPSHVPTAPETQTTATFDLEPFTKWLWSIKDMVNQSLRVPELPYAILSQRFAHFDALR